MSRRKMKKMMSGLLAVVSLVGTLLSPVSVMAEEIPEEEKKPPLYEEVQELLDENEIVTAKNLGIDIGSVFDLENDFSNIEIPDEEAVKVTFEEAKNAVGEEFTTEKLDTFEAIYYVEPLNTDHPKYQISRKLIVKEPGTEIDTEEETETIFEDVIVENTPEEVGDMMTEEIFSEIEEVYIPSTEIATENETISDVEISEVETDVMVDVVENEVIETETMESETETSDEAESINSESEVIDVPVTEIVEIIESVVSEDVEMEITETKDLEEVAPEIIVDEMTEYNPEESEEDTAESLEAPEEEVPVDAEVADNESCDKGFHAKLKIVKQDYESGRTILVTNTEFKVFDLENQEYVEQVTSYPSIYVHRSYFTDSQGYLILPESLATGTYRIEEIQAPIGYVRNGDAVEICVNPEAAYQIDQETGDFIIEVVIDGHAVKGELNIRTQGEALYGYQDGLFLHESKNLSGAEYGIYAAEDIYSPDFQKSASGERNLIFPQGALVATAVTDTEGTVVVKNLPLGLYEVREKNAPSGYVRNSISKTIGFEYKDQNAAVIMENLLFTNDRQRVEICVVQHDAENGSAVEGAILGLYNQDDLVGTDGNVILQADTLIQKMESGEDGRAVFSADIPMGRYYVKELKAPAGYVSSDEILYFEARYQEQDASVVQLQDIKKNAVTTVEISASDKNTGARIGGASLSLLDKEGNLITSWTSQKEHSHVMKRLKTGETYILREDFAPYGYLREQDITFTVEDTVDTQKIVMQNAVPTALLIINNEGEFLASIPQMDEESENKKCVTYSVYAAEDINAADGISKSYYKKDELVGHITTDASGIAQMGNLPVGRYYVKKEGSDIEKYVDLSYRNQDTAVVTYSEDWQDERKKAVISVMNRDKETKSALSGAVFGLFASEEIKSSTGKVLMEKDQMIEKQSTDENGELMFTADLPVSKTYYVQEISASDGYVTAETKQEFVLEYEDGQSIVPYEFLFEDECTIMELVIKDQSAGEEVPGAQIKVTNEAGDIMDIWFSKSEAHVIKGLTVGETYVMTNITPASGYVTAKKVQFTVENMADIQKAEMLTDVTKLLVSNKDNSGKTEVPGTKIIILDEDDQVMESWTANGEAHYVEKLPIGFYRIREEQAAKGYVIHSDVSFELVDSAKVQSVSIVNETVKGKIIINLTDAETENPLMGAEFEIRDNSGNVLETLRTDAAGHAESVLHEIASYKKGVMDSTVTYHLVQTKNLQGYVLDDTVYKISFKYENDNKPIIEVIMDLKNGTDTENPHMPGTATTLAENPKTGDETNIIFTIVVMFCALSLIAGIVAGRVKSANIKK